MTVAPRPWSVTLLTIFPEMFPGPLGLSLAGRALSEGLWHLETRDIRASATDRHASVDDTPFGGGPGMVMRPDVLDATLAAARESQPDLPIIYLTPRGRPLAQADVREFAAGPGMIVLCGRYEGIDERVIDVWKPRLVSLGDFVLSGGEPAAIAVIDACVRLLPGVVGDAVSLNEESFENDLLEYPHYTRPRAWHGLDVPTVLLSGHHAEIATWRRQEAERITRERRPDLWNRYLSRNTPNRNGETTVRVLSEATSIPCDL